MSPAIQFVSRSKGRLTLVAILLIALASAMGAIAYWTTTGSGSATANAGTLTAATISTPATSTGSNVVSLDVQATMLPASENPNITYTVERDLDGGGFAAVASGDCASLAYGDPSCTDLVTQSGTYTYRVIAYYAGDSWTAASNEVQVVANTDSTAPTTAITFPLDGGTYGALGFGAGCSPTGICGTASDPSGVQEVRLSIRQGALGLYWDGTSFASLGEIFNVASLLTPAATSTNWGLAFGLPADATYTVHVQSKDTVGNEQTGTTYSSVGTFTIDTTGPIVTVTTPANAGSTNDATPTLSGAAGNAAGDSATVTARIYSGTGTGGTVVQTLPVTRSGATWTVDASTLAEGTYTVQATQSDAGGNVGLSNANTFTIDTTSPTVTNVTSPLANGSYKAGQVVPVTVTFSKVVNVTGTPQLLLETGATDRNAGYTSGSGSATLTFNYTVQAGDTSSDLDYVATSSLTLNGGTIRDGATNDADLTLASPGAAGSLGANKAIVIDTTPPTVTNVSSTLADGAYKAGQVVPVTVTFSEIVNVTGTPVLLLETGATNRNASYTSGSGTATLTFNYTVQAGDTSSDLDYVAIGSLTAGTIRDVAVNDAVRTLASPGAAGSLGANKDIVIDTTPPTVTNVTSTLANGAYKAGQVVPVTVTFSEVVNVTGTPQLTLSTGSPATTVVNYTSGSGTNTLTFNYTVAAGNTSADLNYAATNSLSLNGGTISDPATNDATLTLPGLAASGSLATNKAIVIDTTAPTVTNVTSPLANGSYKAGQVVPVTVTFSEVVNVTGTPELTLETGTTDEDVAYTSGSGTATLTFNYTVQPGDTTSDLNYGSTGSLSLNGGTISDPATNGANLTLPGLAAAGSLATNKTIVIDTTAPTVTNVTSPLANGSYKAGQVVPVTVTFSEVVNVTGTPQLTLSTGSPATTVVNYTSGSGTNTLTFNYTVAAGNTSADLDYATTTALSAGTSIRDAATNDADRTLAAPGAATSLGANKAIVIDTTAPTVTNVTSTLADGSYKQAQVVPITVTFSEVVTVLGTPQLTLSTGSPATTAVNYTSGSGTNTLTFNYTVAAGNTSADLDYATTTALSAGTSIRDAALNDAVRTLASPGATGSLGANKNIVIDTTPPTVTLTAPASNSFTNDTTPTLSGAAGNLAGDSNTVTVTIYNGTGTGGAVAQTLTPTRTGAIWAATAATLAQGTYTAQATQTDTATNTGTSTANTFTVDTTAPTPTSVVATDGGSQNDPGEIDHDNKDDTLAFTYSENINPASVTTGSVNVTFTNNDAACAGTADSITVPGVGKVCLGSQAWLTATSTSTQSLALSGNVVTLAILVTPTGTGTGVAASNFTWSTTGGTAADPAGNVATGSVTTNTRF